MNLVDELMNRWGSVSNKILCSKLDATCITLPHPTFMKSRDQVIWVSETELKLQLNRRGGSSSSRQRGKMGMLMLLNKSLNI